MAKWRIIAKRNCIDIKEYLLTRSEIDKITGCRNWLLQTTKFGYGVAKWNKRQMYAHRAAYIAWIGNIPEGLCVLHSCDNPSCIEPTHLFVGTQSDNSYDMIHKRRAYYFNKETKRKRSSKMSEWWKTEEAIAVRNKIIDSNRTLESRIKNSLSTKKWWADDKNEEKKNLILEAMRAGSK